MIYLRFAIADNGQPQRGLAEFMFESDDARDCTRRAVAILRDRGHRALGIDQAWEGYALGDFPSDGSMTDLFEQAAETGLAVKVELGAVPVETTVSFSPFGLSYAAGR